MKLMHWAAALSLTPMLAVAAPGEPPICDQIVLHIENAKKFQAMAWAEGVGDDSAPRQSNRSLVMLAHIERANFNLKLAELHKCKTLPTTPMSDGVSEYGTQALACSTDRLKRISDSPNCQMSTWVPGRNPPDPKQ